MIFKRSLDLINRGVQGENKGLDLGLPTFQEYVPGLQPGNIYLIAGETGSGKSQLAINNFIYNPFEDFLLNYKDKMTFKAFIWSCEMSMEVLQIRAITRKLYQRYNILTDVNYILSRGKNTINSEVYDKVVGLADYFQELEDYIDILPTSNPTGIRQTALKYLNDNGKTYSKTIETTDGPIQVFDRYESNNPNQLVVGLIDHVGIIKSERGLSKKEKIDKLIEHQIQLRDMFNMTWIDVQQLNRSMSSTDRFKLGKVEPQLSDLKESGDTSDAANYVVTIFSPQRYEISPYRGYNINKQDGGLGDRFRAISLLKSRDGASDKIKGCGFIGECGLIKEIPKASEITPDIYNKINSIQKL